jgi:hypothetical protein
MHNIHTTTKLLTFFSMTMVLTPFGGAATAADFTDRDLLVETLTADEQEPLAEAEEALAVADAELMAALAVLAAADQCCTVFNSPLCRNAKSMVDLTRQLIQSHRLHNVTHCSFGKCVLHISEQTFAC